MLEMQKMCSNKFLCIPPDVIRVVLVGGGLFEHVLVGFCRFFSPHVGVLYVFSQLFAFLSQLFHVPGVSCDWPPPPLAPAKPASPPFPDCTLSGRRHDYPSTVSRYQLGGRASREYLLQVY